MFWGIVPNIAQCMVKAATCLSNSVMMVCCSSSGPNMVNNI